MMKQEKKIFLSTQGYRGTRDFYPNDMRLRAFLYKKIHAVLQSFSYEEYDGPFLEPLDLYAAKTSEEIVRDQLYSFQDRGERHLAIRPEMTPTLARMVAARYQELPKPIRWYSIPTCMRFERPQRGRLREFNQLNVDLFGGQPLDEDVEIILTIVEIFKSLGASCDDFEILINHRGLVNDFFQHVLELDNANHPHLLRLLDKRDKMDIHDFSAECQKLGLTEEKILKIDRFLKTDLDHIADLFPYKSEFIQALQERLKILSQLTISSCIKFSPTITRGFDYYTGIVFEVFDTHPENRRALFGGGRFDNLVSAFGVEPLPGIGYGASDVALLNFMEVHKLLPTLDKNLDVCVLRFHDADRLSQFTFAQMLRMHGLRVECIINEMKFGKQIAHANRIGAKVVVFRGEDELKNNTFVIKWLATGEQRSYPYSKESIEAIKWR